MYKSNFEDFIFWQKIGNESYKNNQLVKLKLKYIRKDIDQALASKI